jgi:hypothetical protein
VKRLALGLLGAVTLLGCPKNTAPTDAGAGAVLVPLAADAAAPERTPEVDDLWRRAQNEDGGSADDLVRLARREGVAGLIERGAHPGLRRSAAFALGYTEGFSAMAWLGEVASSDVEEDALAALSSAIMLAAQPRRAVDPEDAEELRVGCDKLGALAKTPNASRKRRVLAIRALRMLSDKGCAKEIPTDLDAR